MDKIIHLTAKDVKKLWNKNSDGTVHIFKNPNASMMMGFDRDAKSLSKELEEADDIQIGGDGCMGMGHGIVLFPKGSKYHSELTFIEHNKEKMKKFLEEANS